VPRRRQPAQLPNGRGRHAAAGDVLRHPVAKVRHAILDVDQVEPAEHRAVLGDEYVESTDAGLLLSQQGVVPVGELVEEVVEPYRSGLAERVKIETDVPQTLPHVSIDRMLIGRALTNIIENALHAMPGGGTLTIDAALAPDHMVQLRVTDSGIGMDALALAKIFEPYFSTKAIGTGLGLTIAKRNVEANRGTIAVTSDKGRGTSVTMTLPAA